MPKSILDAVQQGNWDYEPLPCSSLCYDPTTALPGSQEKLKVLCDRIQEGLPLWHPADRLEVNDGNSEECH